jgi:hypothetical protein
MGLIIGGWHWHPVSELSFKVRLQRRTHADAG